MLVVVWIVTLTDELWNHNRMSHVWEFFFKYYNNPSSIPLIETTNVTVLSIAKTIINPAKPTKWNPKYTI